MPCWKHQAAAALRIDGKHLFSERQRELLTWKESRCCLFQGTISWCSAASAKTLRFRWSLSKCQKTRLPKLGGCELLCLGGTFRTKQRNILLSFQAGSASVSAVQLQRALASNPKVLLWWMNRTRCTRFRWTTRSILKLPVEINHTLDVTSAINTPWNRCGQKYLQQGCGNRRRWDCGKRTNKRGVCSASITGWQNSFGQWFLKGGRKVTATENMRCFYRGMWETLYMTIALSCVFLFAGTAVGCAVCFDFCTWNSFPAKTAHRFGLDHWYRALHPVYHPDCGTDSGDQSGVGRSSDLLQRLFGMVIAATTVCITNGGKLPLEEVDHGVVEAAKTMGATGLGRSSQKYCCRNRFLPASGNVDYNHITLIGYSANGRLARWEPNGFVSILQSRYGYHHDVAMMNVTSSLIIVIVAVVYSVCIQ